MTRHVILEVFDSNLVNESFEAQMVTAPLAAIEAEKQQEYQRGVEAGRLEALMAQERELQEGCALLTLWQQQEHEHFHLIRSALLAQMRPLFEAVIETVLPMAAKISLVPLAVEHLLTHLHRELPQSLTIAVHPEDYAAIAPFLQDPSIELLKDDSLLRGRYALCFEEIEATFDIPRLCAEITELIQAFFIMEPELALVPEGTEDDRN